MRDRHQMELLKNIWDMYADGDVEVTEAEDGSEIYGKCSEIEALRLYKSYGGVKCSVHPILAENRWCFVLDTRYTNHRE